MTSAPYLAMHAIHQLARDKEHCFSLGALAVRENMYVDNILAGGDTLKDALETRAQLKDCCYPGVSR